MKNIFTLVQDILIYSKKHSASKFNLIDARLLELRIASVEYTGVWMYINFLEPISKLTDFLEFGYISVDGRIEFDDNKILFDFIISYENWYINIIEIVTPENIDWNGDFTTYKIY